MAIAAALAPPGCAPPDTKCKPGECPSGKSCIDGACISQADFGAPKATSCSSVVIACYDEFAHDPLNLICFLPTVRWNKTALTWRLTSPLTGNTAPSVAEQTDVITRALDSWSMASTLTFVQATDADDNPDGDIKISFLGGDHGDPFPLDGEGGVLGHAFFPGSGKPGEVHLCQAEVWSLAPGEDQIDMFTVVLHEIGHALGLEHSTDDDAVMAPSYKADGSMDLTMTDVASIQALYGSPGGEVPPEPARDPSEFCDPSNLVSEDDPDSDGDGIPDTIEIFVLGSDPFNFDTDGDGSADFEEVFVMGTPPAVVVAPGDVDTDGDVLFDLLELALGTDPNNPDTDGDGLRDGREVLLLGTDPLLSDTDGDGFPDGDDFAPTNPSFPRDCNNNGIADVTDIANQTEEDCNTNNLPDSCELATRDFNQNGIVDDCEPGLCDDGDPCTLDMLQPGGLCANQPVDCSDGIFCNGPESCNAGICISGLPPCPSGQTCDELLMACSGEPMTSDCNGNLVLDDQDILAGTSVDCDLNGVPDECQPDCNGNGIADVCDIIFVPGADMNANGILDECEVLFVNELAIGANNGTSWVDAFVRVESALMAADSLLLTGQPRVEIWVAQGIYTPGPPGSTRKSTYAMRSGVSLIGGFLGFETLRVQRNLQFNRCVLSGDLNRDDALQGSNIENSFHVVSFQQTDSTAVLDGFIIADGNANASADPSDIAGGGINIVNGIATVSNCTVIANSAFVGGGVFSRNSTTDLANVEILGNTADVDGGGVSVDGGQVRLIGCTISNNIATSGRSGGVSSKGGQLIIGNTVIWRNIGFASSDVQEAQVFFDDTVGTPLPLINYSCIEGLVFGGQFDSTTNTNNIGQDPLFLTPDVNLRLAPGSPCIDAGNNGAVSLLIVRDRDSLPRFFDDPFTPNTGSSATALPPVDMGAFEFPGP